MGPFVQRRKRRISPEAGRALEKLGHVIEYLIDEYQHNGATYTLNEPQREALEILMRLSREIYFSCPVQQNWRQKNSEWLFRIIDHMNLSERSQK